MSNGRVEVSVLVPVLNEEANLRGAAEAMLAQELDGPAEFLFIDGGSDDGSPSILAELAERDPRVRVLENPFRRTPHALNIGLRAARGEFIARMDAHTLYPTRYLATGVERLRRGDVESVSGPQLAVGVNPGSRRVALALRTPLGAGGARFRTQMDQEVEVDTGFTGLWRRSTLLHHGGWNEEWINDQDVELAARLRKDGGRIVCIPAMAADYIPRDTLRGLARQYSVYGRYRVKTARRHPESMRRSQVLPPALALALIGAVLGPRPTRKLARIGLTAYAAALLGTSARAAAGGAGPDAAALPAVWTTMHLSYGFGFLTESVRHGPPLRAIARLIGIRAQAPARSPHKE
jgi:glycosyltransferase involved in cell wall biosynthesis